MKYIKIFLVIFFINTYALSNEEIKIPVKYIDLNMIVNNSIVGKKIKKTIIDESNKLKNRHKKEEDQL